MTYNQSFDKNNKDKQCQKYEIKLNYDCQNYEIKKKKSQLQQSRN